GRWALITGASAGIGKAFATVFARNGFNLVLVARREEKLKSLAEQMEKQKYGRIINVAKVLTTIMGGVPKSFKSWLGKRSQ
ncbi:MAG: SDR family NAD(P)-dependent oxidoreductase, partial [Proteobacteria bacterium]|nr:SDR family NAD(P)-dependent oxidoreductase [Pseudomonadota bacterium]